MDPLRLRSWKRRPGPAVWGLPPRAELRGAAAPLHGGQGGGQRTAGCESPNCMACFIPRRACANSSQLSQAQELYQNAQQQIETALRNVQEAARFTIDGENRHPNRHDICREGTQGAPFGEFPVGRRPNPSAGAPAQANAFASGASNASSPFGGGPQQSSSLGQPPALGQRPNPFGTPAFGQPAQPASGFAQQAQQAPGFGQPSQPAASPFGQQQPAQGGPGAGPSAFGQAPQTSSAFGQPSALGAKPNPFGTPAFGQPAQPNAQPGAFGQPAQPNAPAGAFGQPSQLGQKPNPFGSNANATASSSPFATIGGGSNNAPAANPFGAPSSTQANAAPNAFSSNSTNQNNNGPSPFGQPTQPAASPFAQAPAPASNPFGAGNQQQTQEANNPFAQKAQPQTNGTFGQPASNPFSQNTSQSNAQNAASPFGQQPGASQPNPFGAAQTQQQPAAAAPTGGPYPPGSTKQHPTPESYITKTMDGRLAAFKGKPVMYKNGQPGNRAFDGTWHRIWFPNGPPGYYKDTELPPDEYDDKSKAQWEAFAQMGAFADGIMPDLPPPRECTRWDF